jgi:hypothetical protein
MLGSIANILVQRTGGCGEAGGAREIRTRGMVPENIFVCAAPRSPAIFQGSSQMPSHENISRGDSVAILDKKKPPRRTAFQINADLSALYLVAGIGFEPMAFRL